MLLCQNGIIMWLTDSIHKCNTSLMTKDTEHGYLLHNVRAKTICFQRVQWLPGLSRAFHVNHKLCIMLVRAKILPGMIVPFDIPMWFVSCLPFPPDLHKDCAMLCVFMWQISQTKQLSHLHAFRMR